MKCSLLRTSNRLLLPIVKSHLTPLRFWQRSCAAMSSPVLPPVAKEQTNGVWHGRKHGKRPHQNEFGGKPKKFKQKKPKPVKEGSADEVLKADIQSMLAKQRLSDNSEGQGDESAEPAKKVDLPEQGAEIEVKVVELSSTGDGLALQEGSRQIYVVPFTAPGDVVKVKVYRHLEKEQYSVADFISMTKPSPLRDDSRIKCPYFAKCSGCQFQMLDYAEQLKVKRTIVEKAYKNFSQLPPELIPEILDTIGSPLQYGYRTKLTPHFDGPAGWSKRNKKSFEKMPEVGFTPKASRKTMDIEDCPIGTDAVRKGMKSERERMSKEFHKYQRGATILLRESTKRYPKDPDGNSSLPEDIPTNHVQVDTPEHTDVKTCITDNNATSTEYIDSYIFTNPAGAFFQNNNSILPVFTSYVREHILPPPTSPSAKPIKYLIDAYSGSGLFTITLSSVLSNGSLGIDIAEKSIAFARENARLNGLSDERCRFIAADAAALFKSVTFDADETVVVLDPPRKGCDGSFLRQLLAFGPRRILYVSCNVHTQARDVGVLVRGEVDGEEGEGDGDETKDRDDRGGSKDGKGARYEIESLRGFDFFPQTGHVEGVAVLNRVEQDTAYSTDV